MLNKFVKNPRFYLIAVIGLLIIRASFNWLLPLMDKTEARYAEIARIMAESNNWITLYIDYGIPFWAKPPLATWFTALSFDIFGVSAFAARIPAVLFAILIILLIGKYAKRKNLPFFLPGFILLSVPEFYLHTGIVSTDMALTFSVVVVMLSFWESMQVSGSIIWKYLIFVGIGLGLLAKGPIILILTIPPIFIWSLIFREHWNVFKKLPWFIGFCIVAIIAIPWYYLAEVETPGFIDYFVIGEHFNRFLDASWKGDMYGFPKTQPLGMIWVFLVLFSIPWILVLIIKLWKNKSEIFKNKWIAFLVLWLLWTPVFFTFSKSLIHPYNMPAMIPLALLILYWWKSIYAKNKIIIYSLVLPLLVTFFFLFSTIDNKNQYYSNSDKYLIQNQNAKAKDLYYFKKKTHSSQFYSNGTIRSLNLDEFKDKVKRNIPFFVIIKNKEFDRNSYFKNIDLLLLESNYKTGIYLFRGH